MSFSFVWVVYAAMDIAGSWMAAWQGSCQVNYGRQKSRGGVVEG
jgi:hypothetical protein